MKKILLVFILFFLVGCESVPKTNTHIILEQNELILERLSEIELMVDEVRIEYNKVSPDDLDLLVSEINNLEKEMVDELKKVYSEIDWAEDELEEMRQWVYYGSGEGSEFSRLEVLEMFSLIFEDIASFNDHKENWISFDSETWVICEMYDSTKEECWNIYEELEYREEQLK